MNALTIAPPAPPVPVDTAAPPVPMTRLVRVELRKLVDTRAGFWLVVSMGLIAAVITGAMLVFADAEDLSYATFFGMMNIPTGVLLPVLAILLVTSEWSQRTGLVTFTLEPRRSRVITAKLLTSLVAAAGAILVSFVLGAVGTVLAGLLRDGGGSWNLSATEVGYASMGQLIALLQGFGFGMLIMSSAAAIVLIFALPSAWAIVGSVVPWLHDHVQPWADLQFALGPYQGGGGVDGSSWAHLGSAVAIWVALPLAVGPWRLLRSEIK
jgi:hypothetical protein